MGLQSWTRLSDWTELKWIFYCYGCQVQENIPTCRDTSRWVFVHALQAVNINPCLCLCVFSWILLTTMHLIHWCVFMGVCVCVCVCVCMCTCKREKKEQRSSVDFYLCGHHHLDWIFSPIISGKKQQPCKCRGKRYQPVNFSLPFHGDYLQVFFIAQGTLLSALWCQRGDICICVADALCCTVETNATKATKLHIKKSVLKCRGKVTLIFFIGV